MRVLLSTIGSRGDVQPLLALALALREKGHHSRICAPPDFRDFVEGYGFEFVGVGPMVRHAGSARSATPANSGAPSRDAIRRLMTDTIRDQFATLRDAAADRDVIVASTALQYAAHSIAEHKGIPYFFAAYAPIVLPSSHHAPPPLPGESRKEGSVDNSALWDQQAKRWNELFGPALNEQRAAIDLAPVADVRRYMFTDRPLLAADPILAPWPTPSDLPVMQTGAWSAVDERPLPAEVEAFLAAGEPPIYFGFGSTHTAPETSVYVMEAARALGRRAIVSTGWAELEPVDDNRDCLSVSEVNLQTLFSRVAVIVHHGGAGTTTLATRVGVPQVIVPHKYDQYYFADRIRQLGVGVAHAATAPTSDSLGSALNHVLEPEVAVRAKAIAAAVRTDGAANAASYVTG